MKTVGLFASCPVDLFRPSVGFASARLLERAGFTVEVPAQSCCGQVNFNSGATEQARQIAWNLITTFEPYDYIVVPSGSCGGMIKLHYPELFKNDARLPRVEAFCAQVYELTSFLVSVAGMAEEQLLNLEGHNGQQKTLTYHDSCAGLREMGIKNQPRQLLRAAGKSLAEMPETDVCCGFGGMFCVKHGEVSSRMADNKINNALSVNADVVLGGDVSCLLHLAGRAKRRGLNLSFRHVAEVLVGDWQTPAIGETRENTSD